MPQAGLLLRQDTPAYKISQGQRPTLRLCGVGHATAEDLTLNGTFIAAATSAVSGTIYAPNFNQFMLISAVGLNGGLAMTAMIHFCDPYTGVQYAQDAGFASITDGFSIQGFGARTGSHADKVWDCFFIEIVNNDPVIDMIYSGRLLAAAVR
jgi:hypothetical protein